MFLKSCTEVLSILFNDEQLARHSEGSRRRCRGKTFRGKQEIVYIGVLSVSMDLMDRRVDEKNEQPTDCPFRRLFRRQANDGLSSDADKTSVKNLRSSSDVSSRGKILLEEMTSTSGYYSEKLMEEFVGDNGSLLSLQPWLFKREKRFRDENCDASCQWSNEWSGFSRTNQGSPGRSNPVSNWNSIKNRIEHAYNLRPVTFSENFFTSHLCGEDFRVEEYTCCSPPSSPLRNERPSFHMHRSRSMSRLGNDSLGEQPENSYYKEISSSRSTVIGVPHLPPPALRKTEGKRQEARPGTVGTFCSQKLCKISYPQVRNRMKSVKNIQKITKAMKMVAASKLRAVQTKTENSRGLWQPFVALLGDNPSVDVKKNVIITISSDKGLCGGINSTSVKISKALSKVYSGPEKETKYVIVGEKGKVQLIRDSKNNIELTISEVQKNPLNYTQAAVLADDILKNVEFDALRIVSNKFQSVVSFIPTLSTVLSPEAVEKESEAGGKLGELDLYEVEGGETKSEVLQNLAEFQLSCTLFNAVLENACSELGARMSAMDSSSRNAGEMLDRLTLTYNRTRQASITTELTEIISGASALAS